MNPEIMYRNQTFSYLALRRAVGWIGILLPFTLVAGTFLLFNDKAIHRSISHYYHTGMRDLFVGAICAIALFLFFYRGHDKWDNRTGNLGGFFALLIALFPTAEKGANNWIGIIHLISAASFFIILAGFSLFLFTRKGTSPTSQKLRRNMIYYICGSAMLVCLLAIVIFLFFFNDKREESSFVFWAETVALVAFGISWLTKGGSLYPDNLNPPESES